MVSRRKLIQTRNMQNRELAFAFGREIFCETVLKCKTFWKNNRWRKLNVSNKRQGLEVNFGMPVFPSDQVICRCLCTWKLKHLN